MKSFSIAAIAALAVLTSACEKHPASELPPKHGAGEHHAESATGTPHGEKPAEHTAEAPKPEAAKPDPEAKPGEAPKFFPETK